MAKWRELGEVPDSDDESLLDSEEPTSQQLNLPPAVQVDVDEANPEVTSERPVVENAAIWDVPTSSEQLPTGAGRESDNTTVWDIPPSSPLSSPPDSPASIAPVRRRSIEIHLQTRAVTPLAPAASTQDVEVDDNADTPVLDLTNVNTGFENLAPPAFLKETPGFPADDADDILDGDGEIARRESLRIGRSLRPRKPIQEHPYLLENAQYSHLFKSHGVRPVRLPAAEERRKAQEEDSQEQEYEDDSQMTSGNGQNEITEESQESVRHDTLGDDDRDELAMSSPIRPPQSPHVQRASLNLLGSSQDDDDLPSLDELFKSKVARGQKTTYAKRKGSPKQSSTLKLHKAVRIAQGSSVGSRSLDVFDIPPSPPQTSPALVSRTPATNVTNSKPAALSLTPKPSSATASRDPTPVPADRSTVDLIQLEGLYESDSENGMGLPRHSDASSQSRSASSSPEPNAVFQKRIRGVLPASWIRLDKQVSRDPVRQPAARRSSDRSPERLHRKGVAQRRQVSPKPQKDAPFFFDDDSDDETTNLRSNDPASITEVPDAPGDSNFSIFEDDAGSVIEEDHIDHMFPGGRKRRSSNTDVHRRPTVKRRKGQNPLQGDRKRQQRITGMLDHSVARTSSTSKRRPITTPLTNTAITRHRQEPPVSKRRTPPRLSILDVLEPDAPPFLRIAARAASRRPDKGRSSPARKHINLGTRQDNIDVLGVLRKWKTGKIPLRLPSTAPPQQTPDQPPLQPILNDSSQRPSAPVASRSSISAPVNRFPRSRRLILQTSMDRFVDTNMPKSVPTPRSLPDELEAGAREPLKRLLGRSKSVAHSAAFRPAQLEIAGGEDTNQHSFHARKKALDALYRRSRKALPPTSRTRLEEVFRGRVPEPELPPVSSIMSDPGDESQPLPIRPRRCRKLLRPRQVDTTAPQYLHANDPLPEERLQVFEPVARLESEPNKLLGLGPYGTYYTQHFEVFPLDYGVFFHESTLIGQGRVIRAFKDESVHALDQLRGNCTLVLDDKTLCWDQWDAQTSSEFGVLYDWIAEKLKPPSALADVQSTPLLMVTQAAEFGINYLQGFISLPDNESGTHFANRILEVIPGFLERLELLIAESTASLRQLIEVLTRGVLTVLQAWRICEKLGLPESLRMEELLKKTARQTVRSLLLVDSEELINLYGKVQDSSIRALGIRNDQYAALSWVVLMRVLQESRIPRAGFWDIVSSVVIGPSFATTVDAHILETHWHTLFALLPLGEFDNAGVVIPGTRHTAPLEGWNLPQKLLGRVFELYKTNQRQSPSFNDYCRALVSRCHYLVGQWGWRRCSGMIGTIFDFFASQNLSHLRNEQAYKSPQFLDDLAASPSLAVQPEDRCFHIFLKLLALAIQRLRRHGLIKDLKNLIARVLPNHNRQFLKESDVHENELASLRNHHDLLCTLFWCSPQALRPSVQKLEELVVPGNSHKEACLINLRAWNQLARFVVAAGEDRSVYKPFADWQTNVFRQILDQYSSVESDVHQQFLRLSKDASNGVSPELMKRVVNMNKQAATDILHFSMKANLDVMRHAPSLGTASFVLNVFQLHEVFTRFSCSPPDFDWSVHRVAVDIVDYHVSCIEKFLEQQQSTPEPASSWQGDDAVMLHDRNVSAPFFSMARNLLGHSFDGMPSATDGSAASLAKMIEVAGRLTALFLHHKVTRLSSFFSSGKYGVFRGKPAEFSLNSRKYLCLFSGTLVERNIVDFKDIDATPLEFFISAIIKPYQALGYEYKFAMALKSRHYPYLKDVAIPDCRPDYEANRDLLDRVLSVMRRTLRFANTSERQQLQKEFSKALVSAMDQIKRDLKSLVTDTGSHLRYMNFVRLLIPLIKKHDICPVDKFFYDISKEYAPSEQDPKLQTAQILSYGLKLEDEDTRAVNGLFYYLHPNVKLALTNGKLADQQVILTKGLRNEHVFSFMLSRMFPAIVNTSVRTPQAWLLLEVYVGALEDLLDGLNTHEDPGRPYLHREIGSESMGDILALIKFVTAGIKHLESLTTADFKLEYMHTLVLLVKLLNLFGPSIVAYLCTSSNARSPTGKGLSHAIDSFAEFTISASEYLSEKLESAKESGRSSGGDELAIQLSFARLFEEMQWYLPDQSLGRNEHIKGFTKHMMDDIQKTWTTTPGSEPGAVIVSVRGPTRNPPVPAIPPTQSGQGTRVPAWDLRDLAEGLYAQLMDWNVTFGKAPSPTLDLQMRKATLWLDEDYTPF